MCNPKCEAEETNGNKTANYDSRTIEDNVSYMFVEKSI